MTFSPPPPPGTGTGSSSPQIGEYSTPFRGASKSNEFPRRPRIWVPPIIAFSTFAAGYAIPWEFGENQETVILRVVLPLLVSTSICLVAGYYTYRTLPGWQVWTWVSFGVMSLNAIHTSVFSPLISPITVQILLWASSALLILSATLGQEVRSDLKNKPTSATPGFN